MDRPTVNAPPSPATGKRPTIRLRKPAEPATIADLMADRVRRAIEQRMNAPRPIPGRQAG